MITHRLMTERYEAIVRLLYAQGRASGATAVESNT